MSTGITFAKIVVLAVLLAVFLAATPVMNLMRRHGIWPLASAEARPAAAAPVLKPEKSLSRAGAAAARAKSSKSNNRNKNKKKTAEAFDVYQIAAGSPLPALLRTPLHSRTSEVDDAVRAILRSTIHQDGMELIPAASIVHGKVVDVIPASRWQPRGRIVVKFSFIEHASTGSRAAIVAPPVVFAPVEPPGKPAKRALDVQVKAGELVRISLGAPLVVRLPK